MQMGPALLPTPLSPACGHPLLGGLPANLPSFMLAGHTWRPVSNLSLPGLATGPARVSSPALAPASGFRSCPAASFEARSPQILAALRRCLAEVVPYPIRACGGSGLAPVSITRSGQVSGLSGGSASLPLQRAGLHSAEAFCMPSLGRRVDNPHRHPWDENLRYFKALRLSVPVGLCPEDRLKLRLNRRSGNIPKPEFSTSARIACGRGWISQPLVAFVAKGMGGRPSNRLQTVTLPPASRAVRAATRFFPSDESRSGVAIAAGE
jgi:hypothetical protein